MEFSAVLRALRAALFLEILSRLGWRRAGSCVVVLYRDGAETEVRRDVPTAPHIQPRTAPLEFSEKPQYDVARRRAPRRPAQGRLGTHE